MKIAILGATSEIARDMIIRFVKEKTYELFLFSRSSEKSDLWASKLNIKKKIHHLNLDQFDSAISYDVLINFIGSGDPSKTQMMGSSIIDVTENYDKLALDYIAKYKDCRYFFISSGAAYGSNFNDPVDEKSLAIFPVNNLGPSDWYGIAKFNTECKHRALKDHHIIDIRIFNYFSATQNYFSNYFMMEIFRSIINKKLFLTSPDNIYRDFIDPDDLYALFKSLIKSEKTTNCAIDCFSKQPLNKIDLLEKLTHKFTFNYQVTDSYRGNNPTGIKVNYYSKNYKASEFGYEPTLTSEESVMKHLSLMVND